MSESGKSEIAQEKQATPQEIATNAIKRLREATSKNYPTLARLLQTRTVDEKSDFPEPLWGTDWKYVFIRHPLKQVDLEIQKIPLKPGLDFIEQSVRLREAPVDPVVRSQKLTKSNSEQFFENNEKAYQEADGLINEIIEQL